MNPDPGTIKGAKQTGNVECDLYVCLWAYFFAKDDPQTWNSAVNPYIDLIHPKLALAFLKNKAVQEDKINANDLQLF